MKSSFWLKDKICILPWLLGISPSTVAMIHSPGSVWLKILCIILTVNYRNPTQTCCSRKGNGIICKNGETQTTLRRFSLFPGCRDWLFFAEFSTSLYKYIIAITHCSNCSSTYLCPVPVTQSFGNKYCVLIFIFLSPSIFPDTE